MSGKKPDFEDDGRTVADMSGITRQNLFLPRMPRKNGPVSTKQEPESSPSDRPWEDTSLSKKESLWYALGALKAALLIALAFLLGLGLVVAALLLIGKGA
jgi:hypothetical protein